MTETRTIRSERVDDMPLVRAQLDRMGVQPRLDEHCSTHGTWVGLSVGWVTVLWLPHLLSEAEHRLHHVEPWAEQRLHPLRASPGPRVPPLDLSDDRRAAVLEALSHDEAWQALEGAFTPHVRRVYDLQPERVRGDRTTASGSWRVTEDGLLQLGPSKAQRPDLPQVKVRLAVLEPLGWPVATDVVPGQPAAAPLDLPAITRVRPGVGRRGRLDGGAGQMGALATRASRPAGGDCSRCPWAEVQRPPAVWAGDVEPVALGPHALTRLTRLTATGTRPHLAAGDAPLEPLTAEVAGHALAWTERRLVVRARPLARVGKTARRARLAQAQAAVAALNDRGRGQRRFTARPVRQEAVDAILTRYRGQGWLAGHDTARVWEHPRRRDGHRPATVQVARDLGVQAVVDRQAVVTALTRLGWRV
jgi:hypothetical protein